jgi:hypothetical protein
MVALTTLGKLSDITTAYFLLFPLQIVLLGYMSSTTAYINTIQVLHRHRELTELQVDPSTEEKELI